MSSCSIDQERYRGNFDGWVLQQRADLDELLRALSGPRRKDAELRELVAKNMQHYQEYSERRMAMIREDALSFFCPAWCTSLENSFLWIAGCRPTMAIRLVYVLCGEELESRLEEFLNGVRRGDITELSAMQLGLVNDLHGVTLREEERLSRRLALLQEEVADNPLVPFARNKKLGEDGEVDEAIEPYVGSLGSIIEDADRLRVGTLRELVGILTPLQGVELLAAAKQLHLSFHEWGIRKDTASGRARDASTC